MEISSIVKRDVIKVKRSTSLRELLLLFKDFHLLPLIPVVDDTDHLIGVVSLSNLIDILRPPQAKMFRNIPFVDVDSDTLDLEVSPSMGELIIVDDIMDTDFVYLKEGDSLENSYRIMRSHRKDQLPVVDDEGNFKGIIGIFDIVWHLFRIKGIV